MTSCPASIAKLPNAVPTSPDTPLTQIFIFVTVFQWAKSVGPTTVCWRNSSKSFKPSTGSIVSRRQVGIVTGRKATRPTPERRTAVRRLMQPDFSPKQVARAIGASESSLKRWCDQGVLKTTKTTGGHRRISLDAVFSFLRSQDRVLENPDILGLPVSSGAGERVVERARKKLLESIQSGDATMCRRLILDLYAAGQPLLEICDNVIASVFHELGELWECGKVEVFQERHACEIALRIMTDLETVLPPPRPNAPLAIGGSISGDHYTIASAMVEVNLKSLGWRVQRLGTNLPFDSLSESVRLRRPRVFWLSVNFIEDLERFINGYNDFHANCDASTAVVIGGQAIASDVRSRISFSSCCENMRQLVDFVNAISTTKNIPDESN